MRAEVLKGHLDGLLLATLEAGPLHGYAVMEALRTGSGGRVDLPTGTVYPALHRLDRAGLIQSRWALEEATRAAVAEFGDARSATAAATAAGACVVGDLGLLAGLLVSTVWWSRRRTPRPGTRRRSGRTGCGARVAWGRWRPGPGDDTRQPGCDVEGQGGVEEGAFVGDGQAEDLAGKLRHGPSPPAAGRQL
jgi:PadR family transcriptional regulator PadR